MVTIDAKGLSVLVALSIVCRISVVGSFFVWIQESVDGKGYCNEESQAQRWKWMCIVTVSLVAVFNLARG